MSSSNLAPTGRPRPIARTSIPERTHSESSDSSSSSQVTMRSSARPPLYTNQRAVSSTNLVSAARTQLPPRKSSREVSLKTHSPVRQPSMPTSPTMQHPDYHRHRARQHSQGFFEPSLRTTSTLHNPSSSAFSASAIAAQAAMQVQVQNPQHVRRRSQTIPEPAPAAPLTGKRKPSYTLLTQQSFASLRDAPPRIVTSGRGTSAASAAASAYPRSPLLSPSSPQLDHSRSTSPEKDPKPGKEKSRMKIFSKPKTLNITHNKDGERRIGALSPSKMGVYGSSTVLPRNFNQSTTSLADSTMSSTSSFYSITNGSTSTLIPQDKEKHRHNFLSRQKHKLGSGDHYNLPLSSASSNSRPADPSAPQSLYSFAPASPGPSSTFNKSVTGLDLRHGGRALREKKREGATNIDSIIRDREHVFTPISEVPSNIGGSSVFGPPSTTNVMIADTQGLGGFGLPNMAPDDAWPFLKARLLSVFENEILRTPVEDFNRLVTVHLQLCVSRRAPSTIIEDLRELLQTGFLSLDFTLRRISDDRLVPSLVEVWSSVFGTILPFLQAVFLPLDLEFKGRGTIMSPRDAAEFWGALPIFLRTPAAVSSKFGTGLTPTLSNSKTSIAHISLGEALDVRTLVLLAFRDTVILPRHDILLAIFSRLSLDSINGYAGSADRIALPHIPQMRPGTAASSGSGGNSDPHSASFNSQSSNFLDSSNVGSLGARSRATSNTSAGSFISVSSQRPQPGTYHPRGQPQQPQPMDSAKVTQTAAKMLQCVSVLAGLQTPGTSIPVSSTIGSGTGGPIAEEVEGEEDSEDGELVARRKMERLAKELKLNWLGRGRTGRQRRGFVGTRIRSPVGLGVGVSA